MKKTTKLVLAIGCLAALTIASQASIVPIVNGDFQATTVHTPFFDSTGAILGTVPGWTPTGPGAFNWAYDGTGPGDSGIDTGTTEPYAGGKDMPTTHMYLAAIDPAVANVTSTLVGLHTYELTFDLDAVWSNTGTHNTEVKLYADDGAGDTYNIGTWELSSGDLYSVVSYNFFVTSALTSGYGDLAVSFQNIVAGGASYTGIDNVELQIQDTPEPGTLALLTLGGLSALVAIRRRS